jgi:hypothetical protein
MAKTHAAIQTYTLTGNASSITFSNIPQNYTDLKIVWSSRVDAAAAGVNVLMTLNGSSSNFSGRYYEGAGSSVSNGTYAQFVGVTDGATATSNTFNSGEIYIPSYTSSNYKPYFAESTSENNGASSNWIEAISGLWSVTSNITIISLAPTSGNFVAGSTFTLYGIGSGAKATGGTVVGSGNYIYHTFTSTGTFQPTEQIKNAEVLVIAGGGQGGWYTGGGGGAGGVIYSSNNTFNAGASYSTVIGAGGSGAGYTYRGNTGSNSSFGPYVALGGGGGGTQSGTNSQFTGGDGGSGGGAAESGGSHTPGAATQTSGSNYIGYGNAGGISYGTGTYLGGGGGGAGGAGVAGVSNVPGAGGVGLSAYSAWHYATQTGQNVGGTYYIAGGGGAVQAYTNNVGVGGNGGGGAGVAGGTGTAGTANTGGGGGAGGGNGGTTSYTGGSGGSGLVIIRYQVN